MLIRPQGQMALGDESSEPRPNFSESALGYLAKIEAAGDTENLFYHVVAVLHAPQYRVENAGALRQDWPRLPLPNSRDTLRASAALGRQIAALLDTEEPVSGVTSGAIRPELRVIGSITREGGGTLQAEELGVTAGWGHAGQGGVTMPGKGKAVSRDYTPEERAVLADHLPQLGETAFDIYLNPVACWRCVPARVWEYTLGGYQVMKKWLSYREQPLLGRPLTVEEAREVMQMTRRIAALLLLEPALDANYAAVQSAVFAWNAAPLS